MPSGPAVNKRNFSEVVARVNKANANLFTRLARANNLQPARHQHKQRIARHALVQNEVPPAKLLQSNGGLNVL